MMKKLILSILMFSLAVGCTTSKEHKKEMVGLGQYVYLDSRNVLHAKSPCYSGMRTTNENGEEYFESIQFVDTADITDVHLRALCPCCVKDELYEQLKRIVDRHSEQIIDYIPGNGLDW